MPQDHVPTTHKALRWGIWWLALGGWTALLVTTQAATVVATVVPDQDLRFWVAKTGHVFGYAILSVLAGYLPVRFGWRVAWWLFLVLHAGLTECIQLFVPGRYGSSRDVGLDLCGIMLGWVLLLAWQRLRRP
jgi:VanZ family protein